MVDKKRGRRRLGLLSKPGIAPTEKEAGEIPGAEVPGQPIPPVPPDQPQAAYGDEDPKAWHKPCFFSCVPKGFDPVDVYNSAGVSIPADTGPTSSPTWTEVAGLSVPQGKILRLHKIGFGFGAGASSYIHFRVVVDKTPIGPGLGDFDYLLGALNIADMYPPGYNVLGPARIAIEAYNTAGVVKKAFARIMGFLGPDK